MADGASCCGGEEPSPQRTSQQATSHRNRIEATSPGHDPGGGDDLPVVVIGAGPVGLAAAAHLVGRGLPFVVLEAGTEAGAAVRQWGHVRVFSPWRYNTDPAARRLLSAAGWSEPDPEHLPTGAELVEGYLAPLAASPHLAPHVRYGATVSAISRLGVDRVRSRDRELAPFVVRLATGDEVLARAVIDASGTWRTPNVLGANGLPARGELAAAGWIDQALPDVLGADRKLFAGRHTIVVGAGHSAANTLLALAELADQAPGTRITWAVRGSAAGRAFGGGADDALPARGALGTGLRLLTESGRITLLSGFAVQAVHPLADSPGEGGVELVGRGAAGAERRIVADRIVGATGFRPDHSIAAELRLDLDSILGSTRTLAPLIDPNEHSCGTVRPHGVDELAHPEPGYFAVGMKSYGRAPTFLMATGYEQVRSIVAALAGDGDAARDVQLDLPETGVCSVSLGARALVADAATRLGLPADTPARLVAAATRHLATTGTVGEAVQAAADELGLGHDAADELGLGHDAARQLAALAAGRFDQPAEPAGGRGPITVLSGTPVQG